LGDDAEEWLKNHDAEEWLKNHDAEEWSKEHDAEEWLKNQCPKRINIVPRLAAKRPGSKDPSLSGVAALGRASDSDSNHGSLCVRLHVMTLRRVKFGEVSFFATKPIDLALPAPQS
jgi:hypothetical protein